MRELLALVVENVRRRWQERRDHQRLDRQALIVDVEFADGGAATLPVRRALQFPLAQALLESCQADVVEIDTAIRRRQPMRVAS